MTDEPKLIEAQQLASARRAMTGYRKVADVLSADLTSAQAERDEALRERDEARALDAYRILAENERDEARAQVVACQTAAGDLRARVAELHQPTDADECPVCTTEDGMSYASPCPTLHAVRGPQRAGSVHRAANSASVDPSATPDLLGPQIGDSA